MGGDVVQFPCDPAAFVDQGQVELVPVFAGLPVALLLHALGPAGQHHPAEHREQIGGEFAEHEGDALRPPPGVRGLPHRDDHDLGQPQDPHQQPAPQGWQPEPDAESSNRLRHPGESGSSGHQHHHGQLRSPDQELARHGVAAPQHQRDPLHASQAHQGRIVLPGQGAIAQGQRSCLENSAAGGQQQVTATDRDGGVHGVILPHSVRKARVTSLILVCCS